MVTTKYWFILILLVHLTTVCLGQEIVKLDKTKISQDDLDDKITTLMKVANVHGLGIVVFNNNEPVYKKTFGYKNAITKEPIKTETNFYGASLSKSVFAVMVMQLVEKGILDLDKPLQEYLPKPIFDYKPTKKWHDNYVDLKNDPAYLKNNDKNVPRSYIRFSKLALG